jgi:Zn-dependent protease
MSTVSMFDRGYVKIGTWASVPVRLHWTAPLGALLFGGLQFKPAVWLSFFVLVVVHELWHALLVRRYGHHVMAVDVTGFGGLCRWVGSATTYERAAIAWGGVAAQAVLLLPAAVLYEAWGPPSSALGVQLASGFLFANFWLMALNLLPFSPFDGAEAWPLARMWFARWRDDRHERQSLPPPTSGRASRPGKSESSPEIVPATNAESEQAFAQFLRRVADAAAEARRSTQFRPRSR